jgi:hypothetical protein
MKKILLLVLFSTLSTLAIATPVDFKSPFSSLSILSIQNYPNLRDTIAITGKKNTYTFPSNIPLSNKTIYSFLKAGIDKKNIDPTYLSTDFTWELLPIKDMQPGWEQAYRPTYFPKYYSFAPLNLDNDSLSQSLALELNKSPWPKQGLKDNFFNIFSKPTPVYINDMMFSVGKDSLGFYASNMLGLNRFALSSDNFPTNSAIHLSMAKLSVKTLVHEYLHDKIRYSNEPSPSKYAIFNKTPLLGLSSTWDDTVKKAYELRNIIDLAYENYDKSLGQTWWSPMANDTEFTSNYSFSTDTSLSQDNISAIELWDVMQFMEELLVRIVSESLFRDPSTAVSSVIRDIPGLYKALNKNPDTIETLIAFTNNYYGNDSSTLLAQEDTIEFTPAEQKIIDDAIASGIEAIKKLFIKSSS